jgi:hypothetical protein
MLFVLQRWLISVLTHTIRALMQIFRISKRLVPTGSPHLKIRRTLRRRRARHRDGPTEAVGALDAAAGVRRPVGGVRVMVAVTVLAVVALPRAAARRRPG